MMNVAHNLAALTTYGSVKKAGGALEKSIKKLSTGLRINSASDDAAGLAISEKMRAQTRGLSQAILNSQDGISLVQTAEGALSETHSILQRMRELSVQAANDTLTQGDRAAIQLEMGELREEINHISNSTQFNKKKLLNGDAAALWSSDKPETKAVIKGGLRTVDQFGQKTSAEGNYNIDIQATAGQGQVQKSNIIITTADPEEVPHEIYLDEAIDNLHSAGGDGWSFEEGVLTITADGKYNIIGNKDVPTNHRIQVKEGVNAVLFLTDVNIDVSNTKDAALYVEKNARADIYLSGTNTLKGGDGRAALEVPESATLILSSAKGDGYTEGTLIADGKNGGAGIGGSTQTGQGGLTMINGGTIIAKGSGYAAGIGGGKSSSKGGGGVITINGGNVTATGGETGGAGIGNAAHVGSPGDTAYTDIIITGGTVTAQGGPGPVANAGIGGGCHSYGKISIQIKDGLYKLDNSGAVKAYLGHRSSNIRGAENVGHGADAYATLSKDVNASLETHTPRIVPSLPTIEVEREATLSEISQFYTAEGKFMATDPQTLTITQGDGKTATVTLYANDTLSGAAKKINDAIAGDLGQQNYVTDNSQFCTLSWGKDGTSESVFSKEPIYSDETYKKDDYDNYVMRDPKTGKQYSSFGEPFTKESLSRLYDGITDKVFNRLERVKLTQEERIIGYKNHNTMLVRSAIAGKAGELSFSGSEEILNALGLNTIQEATENQFTVSVTDAHTGKTVMSGVNVTGNLLIDIPTDNVNTEIDVMAGITAEWDDAQKKFIYKTKDYSTTLHLSDNTTVFQVGANEGEDLAIHIGDMSAHALGLDEVNVSSRERATRSITVIDNAIDRVSTQRARLGAYQNRLEHTISNLTTEDENLTAAESRIRDADMAKEMMDFSKLQIILQAGNSMLAQANQLPQNVLSLVR